MKLLTVTVPCYNSQDYMEKCIQSLLPGGNRVEIIIIDDGSKDDTGKIADEYARKFPDIVRVIHQENQGQAAARNRALAVAKGEWVCFVDSDDYIKSDYMETYLTEMEKGDFDFVIGGYIRDVEGKFQECLVSDSDWSILTYTVAWGKLFRRSFLVENAIDFSDKRQGEDVYFSLRVYYHCEHYKVIPYAGYYYYLNRNSTTGRMNYQLNFERTVTDMFDLLMKRCDLTKISEEKRRHIEYDYLANMINALITYGHEMAVDRHA